MFSGLHASHLHLELLSKAITDNDTLAGTIEQSVHTMEAPPSSGPIHSTRASGVMTQRETRRLSNDTAE